MTRRGPFVALLISCTVSVAGTSMSAIAVPWLVLTTTGSAAETGLVAFAQMGLYVIAQMLSGPVVDGIGLRRSFVVGNAVAAVAVGAVPVLHALGELSFPTLLALVAVAGAVRGVADTANGALVPMTAQAGGIDLERASGLYSGSRGVAQLVGAPLAGILVAAFGSVSAIAVDAGTFAVAAAAVAVWIRLPEAGPVRAGDASGASGTSVLRRYGRDLAEGARFLRGDRLLLGIILMVAMSNLLDQGFQEVMLPVWVRREIGSATALGVIGAAGAVAALSGNFVATWIGARLPRRAVYSWGYLLGGSPRYFAVALATTLVPVVGVVLATELFAGTLNPAIGATSYERIPEHLRARVLGLFRASAWVGIPFGALLGGYLIQAVGLRTSVFSFGCVYLLLTSSPFVFPVWRQMRRPGPGVSGLNLPLVSPPSLPEYEFIEKIEHIGEGDAAAMGDLTGKVALVTGGSRGIGAAIAKRLAGAGAAVALTYVQAEDRARDVVKQIEADGGRAVVVKADLALPGAAADAVEQTVRALGGIDILVNNAGFLTYGPLDGVSAEELDRVLAVDVRSVFLASQAAAGRMGDGGRIISIGSCFNGRVPGENFVLQAMAKSALIGLTKGLARELGPRGITAAVVDPGPIDTDMNPADGDSGDFQRGLTALGRYGEAEDIAAAVHYLAGPGGRYITGTALAVDGGYTT